MESIRIWIDTDPALGVVIDDLPRDVDDAYVIVEALNEPRVELAGISVVFGNPTVTNCLIAGNTATGFGGGIYIECAAPTVVNCVVNGNRRQNQNRRIEYRCKWFYPNFRRWPQGRHEN